MKKNVVTIKDIAKRLGINPSTVSRALKGNPEISEKTVEAVREVAKEMNYKPNTIAQGLRFSKSNIIGVVIPEIVHFFFSTIISGIEDVAQQRGYNIIVTQSNESLSKEISNLQTLFDSRVDGILLDISKETMSIEHIEQIKAKGIPVVLFDRPLKHLSYSTVMVDDFNGGYLATEHLIKNGYKRIAHLSGPPNLELSKNRLAGYKKALSDGGLEFDPRLILDFSSKDEMVAYNAVKEALGKYNFDAIFAINDMAAIGAVQAVKSTGLEVPREFGVVGFSNWRFSKLTDPKISTIEQPGFEIGQQATNLLIDEIESEEETAPKRVELKTSLIVRESSVR